MITTHQVGTCRRACSTPPSRPLKASLNRLTFPAKQDTQPTIEVVRGANALAFSQTPTSPSLVPMEVLLGWSMCTGNKVYSCDTSLHCLPIVVRIWLSRVTGRCKHYMISQLENGKYVIVGEPRVHNSLASLVQFHMRVCMYLCTYT